MPESRNPGSLLAQHESGMMAELRGLMGPVSHHRSTDFDRQVLPLCQPLVEAIGHRMAYDASVEKGVPSDILDVYIASVVKLDVAWYVENTDLTRLDIRNMEATSIDALEPRKAQLLDVIDVEPYITAPIVSDEKWQDFIEGLETYAGDVVFNSAIPVGNVLPKMELSDTLRPVSETKWGLSVLFEFSREIAGLATFWLRNL